MDLEQVIRMSANFGSFAPADIAALVDAMVVGDFAGGHVFATQGSPASALYLVLDGAVQLAQRDIVTGAERDPVVLREGELFGVYALLDAMPSDATCTAVGPVCVAWLDQDCWRALDARRPAVGFLFQFMLASKLARNLQSLNQSVAALALAR